MKPPSQEVKKIKYYLKNYREIKAACQGKPPSNLSGKGRKKHLLPEAVTLTDRGWICLIDQYMQACPNDFYKHFIELRYIKKLSGVAVQMRLHIEKTTYYNYQSEIVEDIYFLAVGLGLSQNDYLERFIKADQEISCQE